MSKDIKKLYFELSKLGQIKKMLKKLDILLITHIIQIIILKWWI